MTQRGFKFKTISKYENNILNIENCVDIASIMYNNIDNIINGYLILENNARISLLEKICPNVEWEICLCKVIKQVDKNNYPFFKNKGKTRKTRKTKIEIINEKLGTKISELQQEIKKQNEINQKNNEQLKEELKEQLKEELKEMKNNQPITINNQFNQFNVTNLNSYKDPSTDHMTNKDFLNLINKHNLTGLVTFLETLYFKNKENYSIYTDQMRYKDISVYDGKKWILEDRDKVLSKLFEVSSFKLNSWCEDVCGITEIDDDEEIKINYIDENDIEETQDKVETKKTLLGAKINKTLNKDVFLTIVNNSENVKQQKQQSKNKFIQ